MSSKKTQSEVFIHLKSLRKSWGLTQEDMAIRVEIATSTYQYYERGERDTPSEVLYKLTMFGVNAEWLLTGEGEMFRGDEKGSLYNKVGDEDLEVADLLSRTVEILRSGTDYSASLSANIRSFHRAIKTENRLDTLEAEIKSVKNGIKKSNQIREEDPLEEKERFLKKRVM